MNKILSSNDVTDYRGHVITKFDDYYEVVDAHDDSLLGIYPSLEEAEKDIDFIYEDEDAEILAIERQYAYNERMIPYFADERDIIIDNKGNVLSEDMSNPRRRHSRIHINFDNLSSMIKSFNKKYNTTLKVVDTGNDYKVVAY